MEELDTINVSASDSYDHNDRDDPHGERYNMEVIMRVIMAILIECSRDMRLKSSIKQ